MTVPSGPEAPTGSAQHSDATTVAAHDGVPPPLTSRRAMDPDALHATELRAIRILRYLAVTLAGGVVVVLLALLGNTARTLVDELRAELALVERLAGSHIQRTLSAAREATNEPGIDSAETTALIGTDGEAQDLLHEATADAHPSAAPRSPKPPLDLRLTDRHTAKALMAVVTVLVLAVTLLPLVLIKSAFSLRMTSDRSQDPSATTSANRQDIGPSWPGAALIKSLADVFIATTRTPKAGAAP